MYALKCLSEGANLRTTYSEIPVTDHLCWKGGKTIQCKNTFFFFFFSTGGIFLAFFILRAKLLRVWNTNNFEACCGFLWMLNLVSSCFVSIKHISGFSRVKHAGAHRVTPSKFSHVRWWKFGSLILNFGWRAVGTLTYWLNTSGWLCDLFYFFFLDSVPLFAVTCSSVVCEVSCFPSPPLQD